MAYVMLVTAPLIGVTAYVVMHIAFNWLARGEKLLLGFVLGLLVAWLAQLSITIWAVQQAGFGRLDSIALTIVNQFTFLAIADLYSHFINIQIASLRVRVLHELLTARDGLSQQAILQQYDAQDIVTSRLRRLRQSEQLRYENGRYYSRTSSLLLLAKFYQLLKLLVLGKRSDGE